MSFVKKIQDFFQQRIISFGSSGLKLSNFHPQLYLVLAFQGIFFGKRDSYLRFLLPFYSIGITIISLAFQVLNIYIGLVSSDNSQACESFSYFVILVTVIAVFLGFLLNKNEILKQIESMEADFEQVCSLGPRYREPFLESQLIIWKLFVCWHVFVMVVASMFIMYPIIILLYQSLLATQDEYMTRPLVFPVWLPYDDAYRTPNYEMFFVLEMLDVIMFSQAFGGYVYILFHFLLHNYIMLNMIILDVEVIFEDLDESVASLPKNDARRVAVQLTLNKRLKRIVVWHSSVYRSLKTVSSVFRPPLFYQVMISSIVICLIMYQVAEELDDGAFNILMTGLGCAAILQLWIPCYIGTLLRNKGFAVGDACWTCGWHETPLGTMIREDIVIILMRAQMPIFIKYTGQPVLQLETFSAIMSTAYSYFNMLRQSSK